MIKLIKGTEPAILAGNKATWTSSLRALQIANSNVPKSLATKYNHDEVKDALRLEGRSKCMYCESKVEHISDLHIEHIKPKAKNKFPDLTYEYTNLGLACPVCNRNKSDTYDPILPFINPYVDNPSNHFYPCGSFVFAKPNDKRARLTEIEVDLNRAGLVETRNERIKTIRELLDSYSSEQNQTLKTALKKQLLIEVGEDKIYSFCCKALVDLFI